MPRKERVVRCVETGEIFPSIHAVCRAYKISPSNLCTYLRYNMEGTRAGFHWETLGFRPAPKIECTETHERFATIEEAAKRFNVCKATISRAIKSACQTKGGFSFRLVDEDTDGKPGL